VAAALASPLVALPAAAEPAQREEGRLISLGTEPGRAASFVAASSDYLLTRDVPGESNWPPYWVSPGPRTDLRRLDGTVARRDVAADGAGLQLVGEVLIADRRSYSDNRPNGPIEYRDPASGAVIDELMLPDGDELAAALEWGLVTRHRTSAITHEMVLRYRDGRVVTVPDLNFTYGSLAPSADGDSLVVKANLDLYVVDLPSATATPVVQGDHHAKLVGVTRSRYWWTEGPWGPTRTLHWLDRDGDGSGSVVVDGNQDVVPYGDRAALQQYQDGGYDYLPIDVGTGALGAEPQGLVQYTLLGDGSMVGLFDDDEHGHVGTFRDDASERAQTWHLPGRPRGVDGLALTSSTVHGRTDSGGSLVARWDGVGGWQPFAEPGYLNGAFGDVVLTVHTSPQIPFQQQTVTWTASWPGGSRVLDGGVDVMGRGGILYLQQRVPGKTEVREVRTGRLLRTEAAPVLADIDGSNLWTVSGSTLTSVDAFTGATSTVPTGVTCPWRSGLDVAGRWALQVCESQSVNVPPTRYVVDLLGVVPTRPLAVPAGCDELCRAGDVQLGSGFVARASSGFSAPPHVIVSDLTGDQPSRSYGETGGFGITDSGPARLAYQSPQGPRVVDLDWLGTAPGARPDTTAPTLGALTGSPATGTATTMTVGWSATDPGSPLEPASGVASYDVRHQQSASAGAAFGDWVTPAGWSATTSTSVALDVPVGSTTCVQVRARDVAGNLSAWSASRCYQRLAPGFTALVGPGDVTGDGRADLLVRDAGGALWLYAGSGAGTFGKARKVGTGWASFTALVGPGDLTGDRKADLLIRDAGGALWLYPGTGTGTFGKARGLGAGWGSFTALVGPGDLTGDARADLLVRDAGGALWLYAGSGAGTFGKARKVGTGWGSFTALVGPGDLTGDRKADLLVRDASGGLHLYPGTGTGTFGRARAISTGWGSFTALVGPGDLTGDARADLLVRDAGGTLWVYPGTGTGSFAKARRIGSGW
jgi:hypothetical protein